MKYAYFVEQYSFVSEELCCRFCLYSFTTQSLAEESLQFYLHEAFRVKDLLIISSGVFGYEPPQKD